MQDFQVGDTVEVLPSQRHHEDEEKFFLVGSRGEILEPYEGLWYRV